MRIIHLSDIHFDIKQIKEIENFIINPLIADLKEKNDNKLIDAIFITGDLLFKGGEGKIEEGFENFNNKFIKVFEEELGVTKDKVFFCPGNHDIDRKVIDEDIEIGLKNRLNATGIVNKFIEENNEMKINRILNYKRFEKEFYKDYSNEFKLSNFESNFIYDYQNKKIGISCLNTAWRCFDNNDRGHLILGERQITSSLDFLKGCEIKMALIHHSLDDLSQFDKKDISNYLKSNYDVLFSGHSHSADTFKNMTSSGELIVSIAPANWTHGIRSELNDYYNGYAILDIDFNNNQVEIEHRKYLHGKKKYIPNNNLGNDYGKESFPLKNIKAKIEDKNQKNNGIVFKQSIPKPVSFFTGRKKELEELGEALLENSIIGLFGIGGTGKSTLASKYIESLGQTNNVSWFECLESSSLDSLIESIGYKDLLEVITKNPREKLINFIGVIERDEKIIFLDNFHSLGNRSFNEFLELFNEKSDKSKIILISRQKFENPNVNIKPIPVEGLNEDSIEYAKVIIKYKGWQNNLSDKELEEVCEQVKGHPLAITLALTLILEYGEGYRDILKKITTGDENSEALSRRLLSYIFENDNIEKDEKEFLIDFSIFEGEVDVKTVNFVLEKDSMKSLHIFRKNLILNLNNRKYELHPVIREFCYEKLKNKKELHEKVAKYYISLCDENRIDGTLEEKVFYNLIKAEEYERVRELLLEKGEELIESGYKNLIFDIINKLEEMKEYSYEIDLIKCFGFFLIGDWDEVDKCLDKCLKNKSIAEKIIIRAQILKFSMKVQRGQSSIILEELEKFYEEKQEVIGIKEKINLLNLIGIAKENLGFYKEALDKYMECLNDAEKMNLSKEVSASLNNIGGIYSSKGEYEQALENYGRSLKISQQLTYMIGIASCLNNIGSCYREKGEYKLALENYGESLKIREELGDKLGIASCLNNRANIYKVQRKYNEALKDIKRSLKIREELRHRTGVASCLNSFGRIYQAQNNLSQALENYENSLKIREELKEKEGIALSLSEIGSIYYARSDFRNAIENVNKSLEIYIEIGNIPSLRMAFYNGSKSYFKMRRKLIALELFLKSYALAKKMTIENKIDYKNEIILYQKEFGVTKLKELCNDIITNKIDDDLKQYIVIDELLPIRTIVKVEKIGRNDLCTCGSGKKYKKCCGK